MQAAAAQCCGVQLRGQPMRPGTARVQSAWGGPHRESVGLRPVSAVSALTMATQTAEHVPRLSGSAPRLPDPQSAAIHQPKGAAARGTQAGRCGTEDAGTPRIKADTHEAWQAAELAED